MLPVERGQAELEVLQGRGIQRSIILRRKRSRRLSTTDIDNDR